MKIALALGGGAGLGWAHIGVLRALDEAGIEVVAMAGTSIGGVASIAYASGRLDTLEELAHSVSTPMSMLKYLGPNFKAGSVLSGKAISDLIDQHLGDLDFETLPIPTAVVAADLISGEPILLNAGPVKEAIHATIALPGIFPPVKRAGQILSDGGAVMPVPVRPARDLAGRVPVIAVNLQGDYHGRRNAAGIRHADEPKVTTLNVVRAYTGLMLADLARFSLAADPPDLEIVPPIGHIDPTNFTKAEELIGLGRDSVAENLSQIKKLAE